jgi:hypothetical protein
MYVMVHTYPFNDGIVSSEIFGWYFGRIQNDTLYGATYGPMGGFTFLRIKEGDE